jgi:hypothetical protein
VRANAESMIANIRRTVADTHFAVATFSDYPQVFGPTGGVKFGEAGDYPWRIEQDFSGDVTAIRGALDGIRALGGGDQPEAYLRALDESTTLNWRPQSRRIAVLFGDNQPHEPDPGPDKTAGTGDDLWRDGVTQKLRRLGISVLAIYTRDLAVDFYQQIAKDTGGQGFSLSTSDRASSVIERLIEQDLQLVRAVTIKPAAAYQSWVSWSPQQYDSVPINSDVGFDVQICLDSAAVPGSYHSTAAAGHGYPNEDAHTHQHGHPRPQPQPDAHADCFTVVDAHGHPHRHADALAAAAAPGVQQLVELLRAACPAPAPAILAQKTAVENDGRRPGGTAPSAGCPGGQCAGQN